MTYQDKEEKVLSLIAEIADIDKEEIQNENTFEEIGVDSLMALELAVHLEREFGVVIKEEELINLQKVEDLFQYLV